MGAPGAYWASVRVERIHDDTRALHCATASSHRGPRGIEKLGLKDTGEVTPRSVECELLPDLYTDERDSLSGREDRVWRYSHVRDRNLPIPRSAPGPMRIVLRTVRREERNENTSTWSKGVQGFERPGADRGLGRVNGRDVRP